MKRILMCGALVALAACDGNMGLPTAGPATGGGMREYLVLGSNMSFEECKARDGLIIQDAGSPMVACDPRIVGKNISADEFNHPSSPAPAPAG